MSNTATISPNIPLLETDKQGNFTGRITNEWFRFLIAITRQADSAGAGTISTPSTGGLAGGGAVSGGLTLQIADNGVSNTMLRQSVGTSVIGRAFGSPGNVADIVAGGDNRVLTREGGALAFRQTLNGVSIGGTTPAAVRCTTLRIDTAPAASSATVSESVAVNINGAVRYVLLSATP